MTNKQIIDAQKVLSKWRGTPVKMLEEHGQVYWQITFDNDTYGKMLSVVSAVAEMPIREAYVPSPQPIYSRAYTSYNTSSEPPLDYHRDKI